MKYLNEYKQKAEQVLIDKTPNIDFKDKVTFAEKVNVPSKINPLAYLIPTFSGVLCLAIVLGVVLGTSGSPFDAANPPEYYQNVPDARNSVATWSNPASLDIYNRFVATFAPLVFASEETPDAQSFSPVDAFVNIAILGYVSTGDSQSEILEALGVTSVEELSAVTKDVISVLGSDSGYSLNSFWYDEAKYSLREGSDELLSVLSSHYYSSVIAQRPTTGLVNEWLNLYVPKDIFPIIPEVELDERGADAAIVSSYFAKSGWIDSNLGGIFENQYDSGSHKMVFNGQKGEASVDYIEYGGKLLSSDLFSGVEMQLEDMEISFFLPYDTHTVADIFLGIVEKDYRDDTGDFAAHVPYFKIDNRLDLTSPLQQYGLSGVFNIGAAQGIVDTEELVVTKSTQFSTMSFDYGGLYSASVTVTELNETAIPGYFDSENYIEFNRPFVFTATYRGAIILVGQIYNPNY